MCSNGRSLPSTSQDAYQVSKQSRHYIQIPCPKLCVIRQPRLPLPQECPLAFRMLPEYVLEDVIEFYGFISNHSPHTLLQSPAVIDELLTFTLAFLTTPYLKNFHLKSKFIDILYLNTLPIHGRSNGVLGDSLNCHPLSLAYLMPALMQIYVGELDGVEN